MTDFTIHVAVYVAVVALIGVAACAIVIKAGFAKWWILVPLAPTGLTITCLVELWRDVHNFLYGGSFGFMGIETLGNTWEADEVALAIAGLGLLVFAVIRWPARSPRHDDGAVVPAPATRTRGRSANAPTPVAAPAAARGVVRREPERAAEAPVQSSAVMTEAPATVGSSSSAPHCVWCAEALPGSRKTFHNCGPKDRPEVYCSTCGTALDGTSMCPTCDYS
jgi:hypothetical protein